METYTFKTKFSADKNRNGEKCIIVEDYNNGQLLIEFISDKTRLKIYNTELEEN